MERMCSERPHSSTSDRLGSTGASSSVTTGHRRRDTEAGRDPGARHGDPCGDPAHRRWSPLTGRLTPCRSGRPRRTDPGAHLARPASIIRIGAGWRRSGRRLARPGSRPGRCSVGSALDLEHGTAPGPPDSRALDGGRRRTARGRIRLARSGRLTRRSGRAARSRPDRGAEAARASRVMDWRKTRRAVELGPQGRVHGGRPVAVDQGEQDDRPIDLSATTGTGAPSRDSATTLHTCSVRPSVPPGRPARVAADDDAGHGRGGQQAEPRAVDVDQHGRSSRGGGGWCCRARASTGRGPR